MKKFSLAILVMALSACASEGKSVGIGATLGAGTGAVVGSIANPGKNGELRTRNIILGTALGGMAGAATGGLLYDKSEKEKKEAFLKGQASRPMPEGAPPNLSAPKVETKWVEGRAAGNRYVEGHFEYIIIEQARWDLSR